jgi:hypothetical protein
MGKSQDIPQLAVGMNGKQRSGGFHPHYGFFLGRIPQQTVGFFTGLKRSIYRSDSRATKLFLAGYKH